MAETEKSSFQFIETVVMKSIFMKIPQDVDEELEDAFEVEPTAVLNTKRKEYQLTLTVSIRDSSEKTWIEVSMLGFFEYKGDEEKIKDFLYVNAPAILFPYIRSHISSLTASSGFNTIILPTMNLLGLRNNLEENTDIITG